MRLLLVVQPGRHPRRRDRHEHLWAAVDPARPDGTTDQKTLNWQRDTDGDLAFTSADRRILLAKDVVNGASTVNIPYVFTYGYLDSNGNFATNHTMADPSKIVSVQIRLAVDSNLGHSPNYIDMSTTVRPRNSGAGFLEEE